MPSTAELRAALAAAEAEEKTIQAKDLLDQLLKYLHRFLLLSHEQAAVLSLWILHTYCWQEADQTPYISVISPEPRCGKSRLIEVCEMLVNNPKVAGRITAAALARIVEEKKPTLFLDEADCSFNATTEASEQLRQIINTGHRSGNPTTICVPAGNKGGYVVKDFDTFCPKLICSIGALPSTIQDRSIVIRLTRKIESDAIERFYRRDNLEYTQELSNKMKAWTKRHKSELAAARPQMPQDISDRRQEATEQLVAIADLAGEGWPDLSRYSISTLANEGFEEQTVTVDLLQDIRDIFTDTQKTFLSTSELLGKLLRVDSGQWEDIPLTKKKLANLLAVHYVRPVLYRNGKPTRGYQLKDFAESWKRFCPMKSILPPLEPLHPLQPASIQAESQKSDPLQTVTKSRSNRYDKYEV